MIFYDPYSTDSSHTSDRRRLHIALRCLQFAIEKNECNVDVYLATPLTNLDKLKKLPGGTKIVLDIVDGYVVEEVGIVRDYLRYFSRVGIKSFARKPRKFSKAIQELCISSDLITVASQEQAKILRKFNPNVCFIWDCHDEFGDPKFAQKKNKYDGFNIFWEGMSVTIFHFKECLIELRKFLIKTKSTLHIVANPNHFRFGNRFFRKSTLKLIHEIFGTSQEFVIFHEWSVSKIKEVSQFCDFGVIPLLEEDSFGRFKPENKLLLFWRLGLPTLFSNSNAYNAISHELNLEHFSVAKGEWARKLDWLSGDLANQSNELKRATTMLQQKHNKVNIEEQWLHAFSILFTK